MAQPPAVHAPLAPQPPGPSSLPPPTQLARSISTPAGVYSQLLPRTCPDPFLPLWPCSRLSQVRHNLLATQPFQDTFGKDMKRKRPRLQVDSLAEMLQKAEEKEGKFEEATPHDGTFRDAVRDSVFEKGQSKRIWGELYKVLDSSDVIIQVRARLLFPWCCNVARPRLQPAPAVCPPALVHALHCTPACKRIIASTRGGCRAEARTWCRERPPGTRCLGTVGAHSPSNTVE